MATVAQHLDHNRKELLDLSTRNRLLSIPKTSKGVRLIHIVDERSDQVFRLLKQEEKSMSFLPGRKSTKGDLDDDGGEGADFLPMALPDEEEESTGNGVAKRHADSRLQTALSPEGLQRRLLGLHNDARTMQEEQGINVLFLALGQIKWLEDAASKVERFAPLVLLPVELVRTSASDKFKVRWTGEDIQKNLSLSEKLKNDFEINLPDFGDADELDVSAYFDAVAVSVEKRAGWEVLPHEITLGFFSFAKLMMFLDLEASNWPPENQIDANPLITGLMSDGFPSEGMPFGEEAHLDEVIPVDRLDHIVDADGSQSVVVEVVRTGRNLVVQGPPGTGKSQTICNILAAAVLDGKRVLFVAEKMAALEVVKRRLESNGLGTLCLELHSNKANKKAVLSEIAKTWNLGRPVSGNHPAMFAKLEKLRNKLNLHCEVLHKPMSPCGRTPFHVIGTLVKQQQEGTAFPQISFVDSEKWSPEATADIRQAIADISGQITMVGSPGLSPWLGTRRDSFLRIDADPLRRQLEALEESLLELSTDIKALCANLTEAEPNTINGCNRLLLLADHIANAPDLDRTAISHSVWSAGLSELREVVATGRKFADLVREFAGKTTSGVWEKDLTSARGKIAAHGESFFRFLNFDYKESFGEMAACLSAPPPSPYAERLALLDKLIEGQQAYRKLEKMGELGFSAFGELWQQEDSNWDSLDAVVAWVEGNAKVGLDAPFRKLFAAVEHMGTIESLAKEARGALLSFKKCFDTVGNELALDFSITFGVDGVEAVEFSGLREKLQGWASSIDGLSEWIAYYTSAQRLRQAGVGALVDELESGGIDPRGIIQAFEWTYATDLLRMVVRQHSELGTFDGVLHEGVIDEFRQVDRQRLEFSKLRTLLRHYEKMPPEGDGVGVTGVIKAEMARKRGHMPIRKLLAQTGHAIQLIKPVFMMSPLSVAQFLEPGKIEFDLLVIDEASQVEPVDALGAIARCKQVVVVGDSKQLPPSRFFVRMTTESSEDEFEGEETGAAAKDIESILGLCLARGFPQKMLRWHYRSRHHSLIAVSNHEFYDSGLFIVPSPKPTSSELGLRFNYLPEGVFDSGNTGVNRFEAHAVACAVMKHAEQNPKVTLGVAAFSVRQRDAILDELELLRRDSANTEAFFHDHPHEPFFVKNLENVQGDERDVIFISIGYARDASGYLAMRFGPLSADGGERRMNVLISRAKKRCEIFSSIRSDDIDLSRAKGRGIATLKIFLRFAETGQIGVPRISGKEEDSPFEVAVRDELEKQGLTIDAQVGEAGFFIDLAVRDPESNAGYLLGIECDGATYHSSRSARDRDRLRQAVLEDHGWLIHRIWSTDWLQRPERELRRVLLSVEKAREHKRNGNPVRPDVGHSLRASGAETEQIERFDEGDSDAVSYELAILDLPAFPGGLPQKTPGQLIRHVTRVLEVEAPISEGSAAPERAAGPRLNKPVSGQD